MSSLKRSFLATVNTVPSIEAKVLDGAALVHFLPGNL